MCVGVLGIVHEGEREWAWVIFIVGRGRSKINNKHHHAALKKTSRLALDFLILGYSLEINLPAVFRRFSFFGMYR